MAGPSIAVLLGKKPDDSSPEMDDEMDDDMSPEDKVRHQHAAASGLAKAVKEGDSGAILKAFTTLMDLCGDEAEEPKEDEEEEEAPASEG